LNIDLTSRAVLPDQELRGTPNYWEGAVDYSGTQRASAMSK
jgi:predicted secreted hydrolase